jgi:hypothetical protein
MRCGKLKIQLNSEGGEQETVTRSPRGPSTPVSQPITPYCRRRPDRTPDSRCQTPTSLAGRHQPRIRYCSSPSSSASAASPFQTPRYAGVPDRLTRLEGHIEVVVFFKGSLLQNVAEGCESDGHITRLDQHCEVLGCACKIGCQGKRCPICSRDLQAIRRSGGSGEYTPGVLIHKR